MKRIRFIVILVFGMFSMVTSGCDSTSDQTKQNQTEGKVLYQCPMDCESGKTYDKPGHCPVCEMELEQKVEI